MKAMLTIALTAALFAGFAAPALASEFDSNSAFQDGMIGKMAAETGIETASSQLKALIRAERQSRLNERALAREVASTVAAVQADQAGRLPLTSAQGKTRSEAIATIVGKLITGDAAETAQTVRTRQRHEGSAMVTGDYEHSRAEIYRELERNR